MSNSQNNLIFVYGTLKKDMCRNHVLKDQRYLGVALTRNNYLLFNCGGFPGLVPSKDEGQVWGELYEVDEECLEKLDVIEGTAHGLFSRKSVHLEEIHLVTTPTALLSGQSLIKKEAMAYFYQRNFGKTYDIIESGIWLDG